MKEVRMLLFENLHLIKNSSVINDENLNPAEYLNVEEKIQNKTLDSIINPDGKVTQPQNF